jgi:hypothetical protein
MSEFGIVLPLKAEVVRCEARNHLEDLPGYANTVVGDLLSEVAHLDECIKQYDAHIRSMARDCTLAQRLMQLMGVGETTSTALVAMIGNASEFDNGRQLAAWLGLVPGQYSSGGKTRLGRITKAGDAYVRSLLVLGARAVLNAAANKTDSLSRWASTNRRGGQDASLTDMTAPAADAPAAERTSSVVESIELAATPASVWGVINVFSAWHLGTRPSPARKCFKAMGNRRVRCVC